MEFDNREEAIKLMETNVEKIDEFDQKIREEHGLESLFEQKLPGDFKYFCSIAMKYIRFFKDLQFPTKKYTMFFMSSDSKVGKYITPHPTDESKLIVANITYSVKDNEIVGTINTGISIRELIFVPIISIVAETRTNVFRIGSEVFNQMKEVINSNPKTTTDLSSK